MAPVNATSWPEYYRRQSGRPPRDLVIQAATAAPAPGFAIDLGCGSGAETRALLARGWRVLAIDAHPDGIAELRDTVTPAEQDRLITRVASFERLTLQPADLVHAGYSLPYCAPDSFTTLWNEVRSAIRPGGRFAGEFFGNHDTWSADPSMTTHTRAEISELFDGFTIEAFDEDEHDGDSLRGPKHWHIVSVIAKRGGQPSP